MSIFTKVGHAIGKARRVLHVVATAGTAVALLLGIKKGTAAGDALDMAKRADDAIKAAEEAARKANQGG